MMAVERYAYLTACLKAGMVITSQFWFDNPMDSGIVYRSNGMTLVEGSPLLKEITEASADGVLVWNKTDDPLARLVGFKADAP